jgi:glucokinase
VLADELLPRDAEVVAIGIGAAGQIDRAAGTILDAPNLGVENLNLGELLGQQFGKPVSVGNDVEVATLGELYYGSGRGFSNFVCVFVGTGVGGGIVRDGQFITGHSGTAGEIGHVIINAGGRICGCGNRGCLEAYASRTAITKAIMAEIHHGRTSMLTEEADKQLKAGETIIRSGLLSRAIEQKDALTTEIVTEAADYLGYGLGSILNFYNPECLILGGGVIEAIDLLFERASSRALNVALTQPAKHSQILRTRLGDFSGVVGAACLAAQAAGYSLAGEKLSGE